MSVLQLMQWFAVVGIPLGLVAGLVLGLPANRADGLGGYASLRRRAARLGHVASVMLPLIAGFYALAFAQWQSETAPPVLAAWLWMGGAVLLVATLFASAWRPALRYLLPVPATALVLAAGWFAYGLLA